MLIYTRMLMIKIHKQTAALQSSQSAMRSERAFHSNKLQLDDKIACNDFVTLHRVEAHVNKQQILGTKLVVSGQEELLPKTLSVYLSQRFDPIGLKVHRWERLSLREWSADLRVGPVVVRCWSDKGKAVYRTLSRRQGMCLFSTFKDHRFLRRRITFMISGIVRAPKISITCNMTVCGILQITSPACSACQKGDWLLLRKLLEKGKVRISDSTGYGDTLLHVCPLSRIFVCRCRPQEQIAARSNHCDLVSGLLQEGARVDAENDFGE